MAVTSKDIKSEINKGKTLVTINLGKELVGIPSFFKSEISENIAKLIRREIGNDAVNHARSSVTGKKHKALSPKYKAHKKKQGKGPHPNLLFDGDMLGNLRKSSAIQTVKLQITKAKEIKKFYNHNTGDTLPKRQVLPNEGESFRKGIMEKVNKAIAKGKRKALRELSDG